MTQRKEEAKTMGANSRNTKGKMRKQQDRKPKIWERGRDEKKLQEEQRQTVKEIKINRSQKTVFGKYTSRKVEGRMEKPTEKC